MNEKVAYIIYCVNKFAERYGLTPRQSFSYLRKYKGVTFLDECYEAEHLQSLEDAVGDLTLICKRNGGNLG